MIETKYRRFEYLSSSQQRQFTYNIHINYGYELDPNVIKQNEKFLLISPERLQYLIDTRVQGLMNQIDMKFSSMGLLTYKFELKFKKVLLFLQTMDDHELLFNITCLLDIEDLLALISTCKKLNSLKFSPIIEVRILRQKVRFLQSPKQAFNSLSLLPAYYQFLLQQKQEDKQIPKNAEVFFKNFRQYKKAREVINKRKQIALKGNSEVTRILQDERAYEGMVSKIEKQIQEGSKIYEPVQLSKQPQKKNHNSKSYVQKFREEYSKIKEFERKKNIKELQTLHRKEAEKVRIKDKIETPFKTIPIIEIKEDDRISVVNADSFYKTNASRYLNRVKAILGLNLYY